jgi:hypothetical protein
MEDPIQTIISILLFAKTLRGFSGTSNKRNNEASMVRRDSTQKSSELRWDVVGGALVEI